MSIHASSKSIYSDQPGQIAQAEDALIDMGPVFTKRASYLSRYLLLLFAIGAVYPQISSIVGLNRPRTGGSVVSVSDSTPGGCEIDPRLGRLFFPAYFRLSPLQKHVRKVVGSFGKKSCVSTGVRKPGNTYASPTAMI